MYSPAQISTELLGVCGDLDGYMHSARHIEPPLPPPPSYGDRPRFPFFCRLGDVIRWFGLWLISRSVSFFLFRFFVGFVAFGLALT